MTPTMIRGFATSAAFSGDGPVAARREYPQRVVGRLILPVSPQPTFQECLARVQLFAQIV